MSFSRYSRTPRLNLGKQFGTQTSMYALYSAAKRGLITVRPYTCQQDERLDILAGRYYGDGRLWWIIAAASGIGWQLQVPAGIVLTIPLDVSQVEGIVG